MWRWSRFPSGASPQPADWLAALALHLALAAALSIEIRPEATPLLPPHAIEVKLVAPRMELPRAQPKKIPQRQPIKPPAQRQRRTKAHLAPPARTQPAFNPFKPLVAPAEPVGSNRPVSAQEAPVSADAPQAQALLSEAEIARYLARMRDAIERVWRPPPVIGTVKDPLIEVRLSPKGEVKSVRIIESSGNAALDVSLLRAVYAAAPFVLPPEGYEAFAVNRIRFHPRR